MTEYQEGRERWWYYPGRGRSQPRSQGSLLQAERTWERSWVRSFGCFVLSASSETQGQLQSSSKIFKHFPSVNLGITVVSVLQNTRGSTLGRERAHYSENKSVRSKNLKNFPENSRETVSVSTICDEYCSRDDSVVPISCPWVSEDVVIILNLSQQQLWFVLTLLATRVTNINFLLTISTYF